MDKKRRIREELKKGFFYPMLGKLKPVKKKNQQLDLVVWERGRG